MSYDDDALWDVLSKAAKSLMGPLLAPPGSRGIDQILSEVTTDHTYAVIWRAEREPGWIPNILG